MYISIVHRRQEYTKKLCLAPIVTMNNLKYARGTPQVSIRSSMAEHLMTSGDIGRPPAQLAQEFPEVFRNLNRHPFHLAQKLSQLPDVCLWFRLLLTC